ncbi:MAG: porin, partial [Candidatus Auribacterota bacterium]|nr:porin [Candidatus Auribacterota bacterium]
MIERFLVVVLIPVLFVGLASGIQASDQAVLERLEKLETEVRDLKQELDLEKAKEADRDLRIKLGIDEKKYVFGDYWDDGLFLQTANKVFNARIGGSLNLDARWPNVQSKLQDYLAANRGKKFEDSSEVRRARMFMKGTIYDNIFYKMQIDFADTAGTYYVHDMFIGMMNIPYVGAVLVGHAARAWGLNPLPDENWLTFMEWSPT